MAMQDQVNTPPAPKRVPWNKGKLTGAKPPLRPKHGSSGFRPQQDDAPICAARIGMDRKRWAGSEAVWHALITTHKSYLDLSADRQPESGPTLARKGDILPANNRLKHASLTDFIPA